MKYYLTKHPESFRIPKCSPFLTSILSIKMEKQQCRECHFGMVNGIYKKNMYNVYIEFKYGA
jgi:hypothetical protein